MVGLERARHRQLREFSKGMTRRVGLAQALINDPDLIMLDEPTTGLDPIGTREMKDLILNLRDQGKTILLCSHQLADVQDVCDRVAILHQGELKELGRVDDLLKVQDVTEVHARGLSDAAKAEIAEVIRRHGGQLESIDNPTATMEDLFLNIVRESERPVPACTPVAPSTADATATARQTSRIGGRCRVMTLQPEDFWSFSEWLLRPGAFLESALLQGIALFLLAILLGLVARLYHLRRALWAGRGVLCGRQRAIRDLFTRDLPGTAPRRIMALARLAFKEAIRRRVLFVVGLFAGRLAAGRLVSGTQQRRPGAAVYQFCADGDELSDLAAGAVHQLLQPAGGYQKPHDLYDRHQTGAGDRDRCSGGSSALPPSAPCCWCPWGSPAISLSSRGLDHSHQVRGRGSWRQGRYEGETTYDQFHSHKFTIDAEGDGLTDFTRGHQHIVRRVETSEGDEFVVGPPIGNLRHAFPNTATVVFLNREGFRSTRGSTSDTSTAAVAMAREASPASSAGPWAAANRAWIHRRGQCCPPRSLTFDEITPATVSRWICRWR